MDPQEGLPLVRKQAACPVCNGDNAHTFDLDCIAKASANEYIMCPNTKLLVSLRQIAPDVVMEDVGEHFRIEESKLVLNINRASLLGDGAFGAVYRALYHGKSVAAKVCDCVYLSKFSDVQISDKSERSKIKLTKLFLTEDFGFENFLNTEHHI